MSGCDTCDAREAAGFERVCDDGRTAATVLGGVSSVGALDGAQRAGEQLRTMGRAAPQFRR